MLALFAAAVAFCIDDFRHISACFFASAVRIHCFIGGHVLSPVLPAMDVRKLASAMTGNDCNLFAVRSGTGAPWWRRYSVY